MQNDLTTTCGKRVRLIRNFGHFATVIIFLAANNGDEFHLYTVLDHQTGEINGGQWSIKAAAPKNHKTAVNALPRASRMSYIDVGHSDNFLTEPSAFSGLTKSQLLELSRCGYYRKREIGSIVDAEFFEGLYKLKTPERYLGFIRMESICQRTIPQNLLGRLE